MPLNEWIYDWNAASPPLIPPGTKILLNDETLRDGLQNPSVYDPPIAEKIKILHLMESLGLDSANIGLPGAGPRAYEHTEALAREIATIACTSSPIVPHAPTKTTFAPSSKFLSALASPSSRHFPRFQSDPPLVEDWTVDHLLRTTEHAVKFAVANNLPCMYVTEDTIRTDPDTVKRLYTAAVQNGARAVVLCDTVGHATPQGAYNLVQL